MSRRSWSAVALALATLLAAAPAAGGAGLHGSVGPEDASTGFTGTTLPGTDVDADRVLLRADVRTDGSAAWTVEYRVLLDAPNASEGFAAVETRAAENESALVEPFTERMRSTAAEAAEATGREMVVQNVTVAADRRQLPRQYGVVTYRFEWYGFAAVGDRLRVGDALAGLFLDRETTLVVGWPNGTRAVEVRPEPDERRDRAAVWVGPTDFGPDRPRVVLAADAASFADPGSRLPTRGGLSDSLVVAGLLGLVAVGGGLVRRRDRILGRLRGAGESGDEAAGDDGDEGPPEELLSNEEQVLSLVDERGGRTKQQDVVETLEWTETKTSDVVADLREAGDLEVYRLGRENVLALPGEAGFDVGGGEDDG